MKKIITVKLVFLLTLISVLIFNQGCKKESTEVVVEEDFNAFMASRDFIFTGKISDSTVFWRFGSFEFQRAHSSHHIAIGESAGKFLSFSLTANYDLSTGFYISTPSYKTGTEDLFTKVVSPGIKKLDVQPSQFFIRLTLNNKTYTTIGDQTGSQIKVLKMEKSKDELNRDIVLVWLILDCKFYDGQSKFSFDVKKGKTLAGFMYSL